MGGKVSYRTTPDGGRAPYELNINFLDALGEPGIDESDELAARRFLTSQAVMLSLQGMPAIYFHSMFGSRGWPEGVEQTGANRTVNRQKLHREQIEAELREAGSLRSLVFGGYRALLRARGSQAAFAPGAAQQILRLHPGVFAVLRASDAGAVLCLHNVSREAVPLDLSNLIAGPAHDVIGGARFESSLELDPYQTLWLTEARR